MDTKKIFFLEDKLMRLPGLYAMWTIIFVANFIVLLSDSTQGPSRDFNVCVNAASVIYGSLASVNNIFGNNFVNNIPWVHLDIAGTAWGVKNIEYHPNKGATGTGVRLLINSLENLSEWNH